jgi:hypothetical protein
VADSEQEVPADQEARRGVRIAVYVMLLGSAGTAFFLGPRLWTAARVGTVPIWAALLPASLFTLFVVLYTIDRWLQVRRRHYPAGRAFFQVAFALVFLSLLLPTQAAELREAKSARAEADYGVLLLDNRDPMVRAAACELLGLRGQLEAESRIHERAQVDDALIVRQQCTRALEKLAERKRAAATE